MKTLTHPNSGLKPFDTLIPARLDRLPWARFHSFVVLALGITWLLDGLEVTMIGAISGVLREPGALGLSESEIGLLGSAYLAGAVLGALLFGYLTDSAGRQKLFFVTLWVYVIGVCLSAFAWNFWSLAAFRFLTGAGIGGEYAAVNSAIDELIPARLRGRIGLLVNSTYWLGAALGAVSTIWLLDPSYFALDMGWRIGFAVGGILSIGIVFLRRFVPESPRWLLSRGRRAEAESIVRGIEKDVELTMDGTLSRPTQMSRVEPRRGAELAAALRTMFLTYRERSILCLVLMTSQAFLFNAIFFTYALVLIRFYGVPAKDAGIYLVPFALGNFCGPALLGRFFDTIGRRKMIAFTYATSGLLLLATGWLFREFFVTALELTALWTAIFFFASAAASSAYLTVSETFPVETRGLAIAFFFAVGTGLGGVVAPWAFGELIGTGSRDRVFIGYAFAAGLMIVAAVVELILGPDAEGKSLEELAALKNAGPLHL